MKKSPFHYDPVGELLEKEEALQQQRQKPSGWINLKASKESVDIKKLKEENIHLKNKLGSLEQRLAAVESKKKGK